MEEVKEIQKIKGEWKEEESKGRGNKTKYTQIKIRTSGPLGR